MAIDATTEIKGQQYRLIKLLPMEAGRMATRVAQQLIGAAEDAEMVKTLISSYQKSQEPSEKKEGAGVLSMLQNQHELLAAMAGGGSKINAEALYDCALDCVKSGRLFANSKLHDDHAFNSWFSEHPDHLLPVLVWALMQNCKGFFSLGGKD